MKDFVIEHIDPLGQGVFKEKDNIYFIPKTLPEEEGQFEVVNRKKGVHFCKVLNLTKSSPDRVEPSCKHYYECNGCHYLHTHYENEIEFKKSSFHRLLTRLDSSLPDLEVLKSPKRLHYRNRIQLHYDLKQNKIGFLKQRSKKILQVPDCLIFQKDLKVSFNKLFANWKKEIPARSPKAGHVELYLTDKGIQKTWNSEYASGGFSQVNTEANLLMLAYLKNKFSKNFSHVLDLFGGKGNLSNELNYSKRTVVDLYPNEQLGPEFKSINLFDSSALHSYLLDKPVDTELLIVDPPRSGFKDLELWVEALNPQYLLYISCHPATMIRDLLNITNKYKISNTVLVDLFPSTYHFEGLVLLEKK